MTLALEAEYSRRRIVRDVIGLKPRHAILASQSSDDRGQSTCGNKIHEHLARSVHSADFHRCDRGIQDNNRSSKSASIASFIVAGFALEDSLSLFQEPRFNLARC